MKRLISILIISSLLLTSCSKVYDPSNEEGTKVSDSSEYSISESVMQEIEESISEPVASGEIDNPTDVTDSISENPDIITMDSVDDEISLLNTTVDTSKFSSLSDPDLHQFVEDNIYALLEQELSSDDYEVLNVNAVYYSQEYVEELEYNSQKNIYFGYTADEIQEQYGDASYIFTLGDDGTTVVQIVEPTEDNYNEVIRNVAIGAGVILICVTISIASGGTLAGPSAAAGATVINSIFATAATTAAEYAVVSGAIAGVSAGIVTGYQTGDYEKAIDAGILAASEGFMWGAISGAVVGGVSGGVGYYQATPEELPSWINTQDGIPTWRDSEVDIMNSLGLTNEDAQMSFINGEIVPQNTPGATRPDLIQLNADGSINAIEIKNYNLEENLANLTTELRRQVGQRVIDLPGGSTQTVYLDVRGRGYSTEFLDGVVGVLQDGLADVYSDIPIIIYGG